MKKTRRFILLSAILSLILGLTLPVMAQNEGGAAISQGCMTLDAQSPLYNGDELQVSADAVMLFERNSNTLIYAHNPDQPVDPSGMNKLMTALLAVELGAPEALVTVTRDALNSVAIGAVSAGLKVGEILTLKDLLYLMMVGSANDAAAVIAEHIGNSQGEFAAMMNSRAAELGCTNTNFSNANGLQQEGQYSTARDLAKIAAAGLEVPLFVELFSAVEYTVAATELSEERHVVTTNYMMSKETVRDQFDSRVTGGKTGALSTTDRSLICTAEEGDSRYLCVVMSAKGSVTSNGLAVTKFGNFEETRKLLDHGFGNYSLRQILNEGRTMAQFSVGGGMNDVVVRPAQRLSAAMPKEMDPNELSYRCIRLDELKAPLKSGDSVGTVEVWYKSVCVGQCDLVAMFDVARPDTDVFFIQPTAQEERAITFRSVLLIGGIVVLGLVVVAALAALILRVRRAYRDKHLGQWVKPGKTGRRGF